MGKVFQSGTGFLLLIFLLYNFIMTPNVLNVYAESVTEDQLVNEGSSKDAKQIERKLQNADMSDAEAVEKDKEYLRVGYASGENEQDVKHDINLPTSGYYGTTISWRSDKPSLIGTDGKVTIFNDPSQKQLVTLTATINKGYEFATKEFRLWVSDTVLSHAEAVAEDMANIELGFAEGDSEFSVTQDIRLPRWGKYRTQISWYSDEPSVIKDDGRVIRPGYLEEDAYVTLHATVSKGGVRERTTFSVWVRKIQLSDAEIVSKDKEGLIIHYASGDSASAVTKDINLPFRGPYGTNISWSSDKPSILGNDGKVTRPHYTEEDVQVTLTATISKGSVTDTRQFTITVKKGEMSDEEAVALDRAALKIGYAEGDGAHSVKQDLYLPTRGSNGSRISWYPRRTSGTSGDVYSDGRVFRPNYLDGYATVYLDAVIQKGSAISSKGFYIRVIEEEMSHADAVALDTESLKIGFAPGDSESAVTQNINLPRSGKNGTAILWISYNQDIVGTNGIVNRPSSSESDAIVILEATIVKRTISDKKQFTLTVKKEGLNEIEAVALDKTSLKIGYALGDSESSVTQNIDLPNSGNNGTSILWSSSKSLIIGTDGKVNRPSASGSDAVVTLTATISKGSTSDTKQFVVTVKKLEINEKEAVALDKVSLKIGYGPGDSSSGIEHDISLPVRGSNGTSISWSSNKPSIIGRDGKVNRPSASESDAVVILTATISKGSTSDTKQFAITVKKSEMSNPNPPVYIPSENADLRSLSIKEKELHPSFNMYTYNYEIDVPEEINTINLSATVYDDKSSMKINGISVPDDVSKTIELNIGNNVITIDVTAENSKNHKVYTIIINRGVYEKSEIERYIEEANNIDTLKKVYGHISSLNDEDKEEVLKLLTNKSLEVIKSLENIDFIQSLLGEITDAEEREVYEIRLNGKQMILSEEYKSWDEHKNTPQPIDKIWSVKFSSKLDEETIIVGDDYLTVLDEDGYRIGIELEYIEESKTLKIKPVNNYELSKRYYLIIGKKIRSDKGNKLNRAVRVEFFVEK